MAQGSRPARIGEEIRQEISQLLAREVHDPGVGFVTVTRVKVSPDLQLARIYYTQMGDEKARRETRKALERATPFLRRQLGQRLRLRRVPVVEFHFDEGVGHQARVEQILIDLEAERRARAAGMEPPGHEPASGADAAGDDDTGNDDDPDDEDRS